MDARDFDLSKLWRDHAHQEAKTRLIFLRMIIGFYVLVLFPFRIGRRP